jgi:hypothetical protein
MPAEQQTWSPAALLVEGLRWEREVEGTTPGRRRHLRRMLRRELLPPGADRAPEQLELPSSTRSQT